MQITTGIPLDNLNKIPAAIADVEAAGYDGVTTQENRQDPFLPLAVAAVNSTRVQLATGIAISFARSPMVFANLSWDLQRASGGPFAPYSIAGKTTRRLTTRASTIVLP